MNDMETMIRWGHLKQLSELPDTITTVAFFYFTDNLTLQARNFTWEFGQARPCWQR